MRSPTILKTIPLAVAAASLLAGCSRPVTSSGPPPAVPVTVARVQQKSVPLELRAIGNVEAYSTVAIKARVTGLVATVQFQEGQDVKKGDVLFTIDRKPFDVALQQADANLARDVARAENAKVQWRRAEQLFAEGVISRELYDQSRTEADALDAAVRADQAAVERARIDLQYCAVTSPMDGRTGSVMVHAGNVVEANKDPALVVIYQVLPIYVSFAVPEQHLDAVKQRLAAGLQVEVEAPDAPQAREEGTLSFVDNAVDRSTGTIRLKATFPNRNRRLWPGQYVNTVLTLSTQTNALVVPSQAVQTGQNGTYVFVIKPDKTAEMRPVVVARELPQETIIEKGLAPGETVVTDGQLRLVPGAKVDIKGS